MESWMAEHTDCHFKIKALEAELESVKAKLQSARESLAEVKVWFGLSETEIMERFPEYKERIIELGNFALGALAEIQGGEK